jgi:hypothetical protein
MNIDFKDEEEAQLNPSLKESVLPETEFKSWLVEYVGNKHAPNDDNVTVEMIVETVAKEFPEFLMAVAEENYMRGYEQALSDVESYNQVLVKAPDTDNDK